MSAFCPLLLAFQETFSGRDQVRAEWRHMDESPQPQNLTSKRNSRLRLTALVTMLALLSAVYLSLRTGRANDRLMHSILAGDPEGARYALDNGADPDLQVRPTFSSDHTGSLSDFVRLLLHRSLNPAANNSKTALMHAVGNGNAKIVTELLQHGANVNIRLDNGNSALIFAASKQPADMAAALLAKGADFHVHNRQGETPLLFAAQTGQTQIVRMLLAKGEDIHEADRRSRSALSLAVENGREATVELLLAQGADEHDLKSTRASSNSPSGSTSDLRGSGRTTVTVNGVTTISMMGAATQNLNVMPPLVFAAKYGSTALLQFLWARTGSDVKQRYGWNILCNAVQSDRPNAVKFLLDQKISASQPPMPMRQKGSPVHFFNGYDPSKVYTPLHYAAALQTPEIARLLIEHGADVNAEDMAGTTPLLAAVGGSHLATLRLLIEHGANARAAERTSGRNALMRGVYDVKVARLLLDHGVDVDARDRSGRTALMQCYSPPVTALLIERGADINARDVQGATALLMAARYQQTECVRLLLQHGAAVDVVDSQAETPLSVARTMRSAPLIALLIGAGAKR